MIKTPKTSQDSKSFLLFGVIIRRNTINVHSYADDTQPYVAVSPFDTGPKCVFLNCILDIKTWITEHFLLLNQDKTKILVVFPEAQREKLHFKLKALGLKPSKKVNPSVVYLIPNKILMTT